MIKNPVCLVQRSVKKVRSIEEKNLPIHGCKGKDNARILRMELTRISRIISNLHKILFSEQFYR